MTYPFFISNRFSWFFRVHMKFFQFFSTLNIFLKILKNERNVTNFRNFFVVAYHTHTNFPGVLTNSCTVIASILFSKTVFSKTLKKIKLKINKNKNKERIGYLVIYWTIFCTYLLMTFRHYYANVLDIFDMGNFFPIFVASRNTEIPLKSNFWLGM